ncbi:hypothetical protein HDV63DRAFT_387175 [Trichoderma sp. SZMC 28014]
MANNNKTYFLVSSWDFPKGSICLGSLTSSPAQPHITLYKPNSEDIDTPTFPTTKSNFSAVIESEKGHKGGLFFRFLDLFGLGASASVQFDRKALLKYAFEHMHTEWFLPSDKLVEKAVRSNRVVSYFRRTGYESPLYMITGLKIVEGASVTTVKNKGKGFVAFLGVDAEPVSVGPQTDHKSQDSELQTFSNSTPIVFAFQLMEVRCDADGSVATKEYNNGALFGLDSENDLPADELENTSTEQVTSEAIQAEFGDAFLAFASMDEEDGLPCTAILPNTDQLK